jgi:hypothetical protein
MSWTVGRLKELILMYHSDSPSVRSQTLTFNGEIMKNSVSLKSYFNQDSMPEVSLSIEEVENLPEDQSGLKSQVFKHRELEYLKKYELAKQLLLDNRNTAQDSPVIPRDSVISTLPVSHPEFMKRVRAMPVVEKRRPIRLRKIPIGLYFDLNSILRWMAFTFITQILLEYKLPKIYYIFVFVCYLMSVKDKIDKHLEKELRKIPRDLLVKVLPHRFRNQSEQIKKISVIYVVFETFRALVLSFLPWFDPMEYSNQRSHLYNINDN